MDVHHILNKEKSRHYFPNSHTNADLAIGLPNNEHFLLSKYRKKSFLDFNDFIEEEMRSFEAYTNLPEELLERIKIQIKKNNKNECK